MKFKQSNYDALGFLSLIFLILFGFKLLGSSLTMDWPWWTVFSPALLGLALYIQKVAQWRSEKRPSNFNEITRSH